MIISQIVLTEEFSKVKLWRQHVRLSTIIFFYFIILGPFAVEFALKCEKVSRSTRFFAPHYLLANSLLTDEYSYIQSRFPHYIGPESIPLLRAIFQSFKFVISLPILQASRGQQSCLQQNYIALISCLYPIVLWYLCHYTFT